MRIGLMTPGYNSNDAIGNDVLGMASALLSRGDEVILFTPTGEASFPGKVMHYKDTSFVLSEANDLIIYHYCVADRVGLDILSKLHCRVAVRYHNVTPAIFMAKYSSDFGRSCQLGRSYLYEIGQMKIDAFISDSRFNMMEILELGALPSINRVLPPLHRCDELVGYPDSPEILRRISQSTYNIVTVGRLMPNKGFDIMAEAFGVAQKQSKLKIHLHHVGSHDPRMQTFIDKVGRVLADRNVRDDFTFHGHASGQNLATLYRHCDLFWTTSLHEGFCVPAVEAMAFGLPILSSRHAALPETCGDVAVFADTISDHANILEQILVDDVGRRTSGRKSRERYESVFGVQQLKKRFLGIVDEICDPSWASEQKAVLETSDQWFGLPNKELLLAEISVIFPTLSALDVKGDYRQRDIIYDALTSGCEKSERLKNYVRSREFIEYITSIEVPLAGRHLSPEMRFCWKFCNQAHSAFDLKSGPTVAAFWRWYSRGLEQGRLFPPPLAS